MLLLVVKVTAPLHIKINTQYDSSENVLPCLCEDSDFGMRMGTKAFVSKISDCKGSVVVSTCFQEFRSMSIFCFSTSYNIR